MCQLHSFASIDMASESALNTLLRNTFASSTPDEAAFVYYPKNQLDPKIFRMRFGVSEADDEGVIYSLTKIDLLHCFKENTPKLYKFSWILSIAPCAEKSITSVVAPSNPPHASHDLVTATYAPEYTSMTTGMTVVHFYDECEAERFKKRLEMAP